MRKCAVCKALDYKILFFRILGFGDSRGWIRWHSDCVWGRCTAKTRIQQYHVFTSCFPLWIDESIIHANCLWKSSIVLGQIKSARPFYKRHSSWSLHLRGCIQLCSGSWSLHPWNSRAFECVVFVEDFKCFWRIQDRECSMWSSLEEATELGQALASLFLPYLC